MEKPTLGKSKTINSKSLFYSALTEAGDIYMFGFGMNGQMGRGDEVDEGSGGDKLVPNKVNFFERKNLKATNIACGGNHTFAESIPK